MDNHLGCVTDITQRSQFFHLYKIPFEQTRAWRIKRYRQFTMTRESCMTRGQRVEWKNLTDHICDLLQRPPGNVPLFCLSSLKLEENSRMFFDCIERALFNYCFTFAAK